MSQPATEVGLKILESLGLPKDGVRAITIRIQAGEIPVVEIQRLLMTSSGVETALQGYQLTEITNEP